MSITHSSMNNYWLVTIKCKDRTKLLFDTVCTLADMDYDVFHATIDSIKGDAMQEYYIRPRLGKPGEHPHLYPLSLPYILVMLKQSVVVVILSKLCFSSTTDGQHCDACDAVVQNVWFLCGCVASGQRAALSITLLDKAYHASVRSWTCPTHGDCYPSC